MNRAILVMWLFFLIGVQGVFAVEYQSDRMNLAPGVSRVHTQVISNVSGNISVSIPSDFSLSNASNGSVITSVNVTWLNLSNAVINYTLVSPSNCTENRLFYSDIFINGSDFSTFLFICLSDSNVVDFKVEYGHGQSNYLGVEDELIISNQSAVLFNLVRVFNVGYLFEPNENPENASLLCRYEILPIRTYGGGEVRRGATWLNMSYFWSKIRSGFWFRLGVMSQTFTARPPGNSYNVSCTNLSYQLAHTRVQAPFTNYSLTARSEFPFTISQVNDTGDESKWLYVVQNAEQYTVTKVRIVFALANQTKMYETPRLSANQSLVFRFPDSSSTNISVYFIPPWFRHSLDSDLLSQNAYFENRFPILIDPGNQTASVNVTFTLQINGSDPDGRSITYRTNSTLFSISSSGLINFTPNSSMVGNYSILVNVTDTAGTLNRTIFNLEVVYVLGRPRLFNPGNLSAPVNNSFVLQINASDPEGEPLAYLTNSTLFSISSVGIIQFVPNVSSIGNHSILVNVTDSTNLVNSTIFNIQIRSPIPPSDANFSRAGFGSSEGGLSTNFTNSSLLTNVSGFQLGNRNGTINWSFHGVFADRSGDAIATQVIIGRGFVFFNTTAFDPTFNRSAVITFFNTSCPHNLKPIVFLGANGVNFSTVQGQGHDCNSMCSNVTCTSGSTGLTNVSFIISHFTSFASFGNANLTIDNNGPVTAGSVVLFNASYINRTSGASITGALCNISVTDDPSRIDNFSNRSNIFIFNRTFNTSGSFVVNVSCSASGVSALNALDNLTIVSIQQTISQGGGGGSVSAAYAKPLSPPPGTCQEQWDCTAWTPCLGGQHARTCFDLAGCGTKVMKPPVVEPCLTRVPVPIINITFAPKCNDGIMNQGEEGVDCGPPCSIPCTESLSQVGLASETPGGGSSSFHCGDGSCAPSETCACAADCGLQIVKCPKNRRTLFFGMVVVLMVVLIGLLEFQRFRRRKDEDDF